MKNSCNRCTKEYYKAKFKRKRRAKFKANKKHARIEGGGSAGSSRPSGMTNEEIDHYISKNKSIEKNYCGTYAIDTMVKGFSDCLKKMKMRNAAGMALPVAIANTQDISGPGEHWFALMKLQTEKHARFFLFDSFGGLGLSHFIISDDADIIETFCTFSTVKGSNGFSYYEMTFEVEKYLQLLKNNELTAGLSMTAICLFNFLTAFAASLGVPVVKINSLLTQIQSLKSATCGIFCLMFLNHVYNFSSMEIMEKHAECVLETIQDIISDLFDPGINKKLISLNEVKAKAFIHKQGIKGEFY